MNESKRNRVGRVLFAGVVAITATSMLVGAEGGGKGGGGGGGHAAAPAVSGGGGAAHAAAPAQAAPAAPANNNAVHPQAVHQPYNPYVPESQRQAAVVRNSTAANTVNSAAAVQNSVARTENRNEIRENRENRENRNNQNNRGYNGYGVAYGYPWYPFSYGWGDGWYGGYGTQYGYPGYVANSNYPYDLPYGEYNNQESLQANPPNNGADTGQSTVIQPAQGTGVPLDGQSANARAANAVNKSPEMVSANNAVAQAQSAYNTERERVLAALAQKPDYQAALSRRRAAAAEVHNATTQSSDHVSPAVTAAANQRMEAGDEVTKMEEQAVATDPAAAATKARMEQAVADRNSLQSQLNAQAQQQR